MNYTPETDNLARGNHVVPTEWAQQLERERDEAREDATNYYAKIGELTEELDKTRERAERYRLEANAMMLQRDEAREALREIANAGHFDNIGNWARNTARKALEAAE